MSTHRTLSFAYRIVGSMSSRRPRGGTRIRFDSALIKCAVNNILNKSSVSKMRCSNATVGQIWFLLACTYKVVNTHAFPSPRQTLSNPFATSLLVNITNLDSSIDRRFGFKALYGETNLPLTSCFMNIVELLAQYAELDWLSKVRQRHGVVLPAYPQVEIAVLPAAPATSVEVRLVIWGIWVGVRDIINRNNYHEAEFEVLWEGEVVAYIYFTKPTALQLTDSNGSLGRDRPLTRIPSPNKTTSGSLDILSSKQDTFDTSKNGEFSWIPIIPPNAKPLTVIEVFLTVMAGLKNAAPHPASDKVPGPYASAALEVFANVQFYIHKRRAPRPKPPFFQYIHVIKALRLVPGYLLDRRIFAELFFSIDVSGVTVGEGYLEKGHYRPPHLGDALGPIDNVSIS